MYEPDPLMVIDSPQQMKAFTDPLRIRVLMYLTGREATNQQLADALDEPHAKVLYHVRFLLKTGLIRLVNTRIKGGNVEKYYRSAARTFDFQPSRELWPAMAIAEIDAIRQDAASSAIRFPEHPPQATIKGWHATEERARETYLQMVHHLEQLGKGLADEFPLTDEIPSDAPDAPAYQFAMVMYRNPHDPSRGRGN
jgi:hypothetical protein